MLGNARTNLATFVSTWMEPQADKLMAECFDKNMIDKDSTRRPRSWRCGVEILSRLWNARTARRRRVFHDRVERGGHARWPRPQAPVAEAAGS